MTLPTATDPAAEFHLPVRVYYEDSDAGGVVYYANYLRFMERARTEWLRALGLEQDELSRDPGVVFAVRACTLEFRKPARFNDLLAVTVRVAHRGGASLTFAQQVRREGEVLCEGEVRIACLDAQRFTPRPLPPALIDRLPPETA
ncbi:MAG: tol-pal system-associated acyl-CoA thioesterase [Pseudomonadota bacterium]